MAYPIPKYDNNGVDIITETMTEGAKSYTNGEKIEACPYSKFSDKGRLWLKGFANAGFGAQQLT